MNDVLKTYVELYNQANKQVKTAGALEKALPWLAGGGLLTAGAGIPYAYRQGREAGQEAEAGQKPITFGAGALAGLAAPHILRRLQGAASGLDPNTAAGLYDEFTRF